MQEARQHVARQQHHAEQHQSALGDDQQRLPAQAGAVARLAGCGQADHHQDHDDVLHDQEADGDAAVQ